MPIGPGKYDDLATYVREQTQAQGVAVIVFRGNQGNGFAVQGSFDFQLLLPDMLDHVSGEIKRSMEAQVKEMLAAQTRDLKQ